MACAALEVPGTTNNTGMCAATLKQAYQHPVVTVSGLLMNLAQPAVDLLALLTVQTIVVRFVRLAPRGWL